MSREPLSQAESLLLDAYIETLKEEPRPDAHERFHATCDFLEGAEQCAKATVKLREIEQADASN